MNDQEAIRMRSDLSTIGWTFCISGFTVMFVPVLWLVFGYGVSMTPGLIAGGIIALALVLIVPGHPTRTNPYARYPKQQSDYELRMQRVLRQRRNRKLMVAATVPFFAVVFASLLLSDDHLASQGIGTYFAVAVLAFFHILTVGWGVQYLQVSRSFTFQGESQT